ncbi:hypothetical protein LCGC14_2091370, partial [marine sediment metagenome]
EFWSKVFARLIAHLICFGSLVIPYAVVAYVRDRIRYRKFENDLKHGRVIATEVTP